MTEPPPARFTRTKARLRDEQGAQTADGVHDVAAQLGPRSMDMSTAYLTSPLLDQTDGASYATARRPEAEPPASDTHRQTDSAATDRRPQTSRLAPSLMLQRRTIDQYESRNRDPHTPGSSTHPNHLLARPRRLRVEKSTP